ncbi:hypothetical protein QNH20_26385 [Neobacillus sp. WH10]|uniref:hypothetical protein n=1 Tax=Neobacillus sp. WH10 TaxID=3047873 RepID=UPI0024C1602D|nr:hypothetical protein [Neobacillus sp. WH10]WHY77544.1 hypothetical protein QNH20_26385 [Neobacillus sp. WH10]
MKRIIALSSFLFLLLMTALPAGVSHAAAATVELTGITVVLDDGNTINATKVGDNQFTLNLVGDEAFGEQIITKVIVKSPTAETISLFSKDDEDYSEDNDLHFVNGEAVIDSAKFADWMNRIGGEEAYEDPGYLFNIDFLKILLVPSIAGDDFEENHHNSAYNFTVYLADKDGNESPATLTVKTQDWESSGKGWKYLSDTGEYVTNWHFIDGKWYYFGTDTIMKTGWQYLGGKWYFLNQSGVMETGWKYLGGKWYFLNQSGAMETGLVKSSGKFYILGQNGAMLTGTGWVKSGNNWYFLEKGDTAKIGWVKSGNKWYYLDPASGTMKTGWVKDGSKWYYLENSGAMKTGWVKSGNKWYYLDNSGAMKTGWVKVSNKWYFLYSNGQMAVNTKIGTYRVGADGAWIQ